MYTENTEHLVKEITDASAGLVAVSTLLEWLPAIASLFTIIWIGIRIWEKIYGLDFYSSTFARLFNKGPKPDK